MEISKRLNKNLKYEFCELRANVLCWCLQDVWNRLDVQKKIIPTKEEKHLGTIWELIELQVRGAVKELNKKGYCTTDSGFWGETGNYQKQFISGLFKLDSSITKLLMSKGIRVAKEGSWTHVSFIPTNPDLDEIKQTWNEIVVLFPDLGHPAKSQNEIFQFDEDKILRKLFER